LPHKYFSIPVYIDKTDEVTKIGDSTDIRVFVFVKEEDFTADNKTLLTKILQAIKLDINKDVQILLLKSGQNAYIIDKMNLEEQNLFIAFGLNAKRLGLQTRTIPYKWMAFDNLKVLFSHTISDLQTNVNNKKQLWGLLQELNKK